MVKKISFGIFQFDILWENIKGNLNVIEETLNNLQALPDVFVLPEMYSTGFTMHPEKLSNTDIQFQKEWLLRISEKFGVYLLGSVIDKAGKYYFNRMFLINPEGSVSYYDKRHLFRMSGEDAIFQKGTERKVFKIGEVAIFPQICYDLRFPVWSRNTDGYHILINVANWPSVRQDVWNTLLRARAIENQCFTIGVNRVGKDENGIEYRGGSVVINALGQEILNLGNRTAYEMFTLDLEEILNFRKKFPVYKDADEFELKNRE